MKKIIIIALAVLLCGTAYASKFEVSGSAVMKGKYWSNYAMDADADSHSYYDYDFNIFPKFVVDENNFAMLKVCIKDIKPGAARSTATGNADAVDIDEEDENIRVERAFFQTKIGPTALSLGLMDGYAWASDFGNSTQEAWRVKTVTTTPVGAIIAIIQKNAETSSNTSDSGDDDVLYLAMVSKAGPMFIKPLLVYADVNSKSLTKTAFQLGLDGTFGDISIEAEFQYQSVEGDDVDTYDYSTLAFYLHASMKMGDNAAGLMVLYAGVDETDGGTWAGAGFGDDAAYLTILDDEMEVGRTDGNIAGAGGLTVIAAYFSMQVSDKLSITPKFGYVINNYDENATVMTSTGPIAIKGNNVETAMELDIDCTYKINDAVNYNFGVAYATLSAFSGTDPDPVWTAQHSVKISF